MSESVSFDRAAGYYDRTRAMPEALMSRVVETLESALHGRGVCLEIGVGTGRIALPLMRAGAQIIGLDLSRQMLQRLRSNAGAVVPPLVQGDATRLPFPDQSFDAALAAHVFHLIPNWKLAVSELLRVLRPGGLLIATRGARSAGSWAGRVRRHFFDEAGNPPWPPGVDTIDELDAHLLGIGAAVEVLAELSVESTVSVGEIVARLEAGYFSACWNLSEASLRHAAAATRRWAEGEFGDLDRQLPTTETSVWHAYRPSLEKR